MAAPLTMVISELAFDWSGTKRWFVFDLDDGKSFCYRSRTSSNSFFHGRHRRNWKPNPVKPQFLYIKKHIDEFNEEKEIKRGIGVEEVGTTHYLKNIWEFYKMIGWDYKNKKWVA